MNNKTFYHPRALVYKVFLIAILCFVLFLILLKEKHNFEYTDVAFLDVGQGDGALIEVNGHDNANVYSGNHITRLMIDTGKSSKTITSIENFYNRDLYNYFYNHEYFTWMSIFTLSGTQREDRSSAETIDILLLTHNDDDHIGMRCAIVEKYHVKKIIISDSISTSSLLSCDKDGYIKSGIKKFQTNRKDKNGNTTSTKEPGIEVLSVHTGDSFNINDNKFYILNPDQNFNPKSNHDNEESIVVLATIDTNNNLTPNPSLKERVVNSNNVKILFTGDIDKKVERGIINEDATPTPSPSLKGRGIRNIDILKVAHHGSDGSSDPIFIKYIHPTVSVISVGKNNYGHPSPRVINDLISASSTIHRTDQEGNVVFHF